MSLPFTDRISLFTIGTAGVTATTTGPGFDVSKRQNLLVVFTASSISSGNGVFTMDGSLDNSYWVTGITMTDAAAINTSTTAGVLSTTISSNGNKAYYIRPGWKYLRCKVVRTTDGRYTATLGAAG